MELVAAFAILDKIEFSLDGFIKRNPEESELKEAIQALKKFTNYQEPTKPEIEILHPQFDVCYPERKNGRYNSGGAKSTGMKAVIGREDSKVFLHLTGRYGNFRDVDIKFFEGDTAIYDSYNFDYLGTITKITERSVTIEPNFGGRRHRLDLAKFANRNNDFDLEKSHQRRMNWYD